MNNISIQSEVLQEERKYAKRRYNYIIKWRRKRTIVTADTDKFKNIIIVELEDHDVRVVDRETLTLAPAKYHDNFGSHSKIW